MMAQRWLEECSADSRIAANWSTLLVHRFHLLRHLYLYLVARKLSRPLWRFRVVNKPPLLFDHLNHQDS